LLEGFSKYYQKNKVGKLYVTIGKEFQGLQTLISDYQQKGIPIINVGFLNRAELEQLYQKSEFLIFPSLTESFGLGILEAMEHGCKVIGADLPYTHAVCIPSLLFNPDDVNSIAAIFNQAVTTNTKPTKQLVFNEIDKLIQLLR
jgi:glycosyltransferase involved in cell wall biosynthesis